MSNQNLTALRQYLDGIASGEVSELEQLPDLLARCWNALMIADMHGMKPEKLDSLKYGSSTLQSPSIPLNPLQ